MTRTWFRRLSAGVSNREVRKRRPFLRKPIVAIAALMFKSARYSDSTSCQFDFTFFVQG